MWASETPLISPSLSSDTEIATEGYFVLSWVSNLDQGLQLQQSNASNFIDSSRREVPPSGSLTITGLQDGDYYFRLQQGSITLTDPIQVSVRHHSMSRALGFFSLGLLLFIALVVTIIIGHNKQNG